MKVKYIPPLPNHKKLKYSAIITAAKPYKAQMQRPIHMKLAPCQHKEALVSVCGDNPFFLWARRRLVGSLETSTEKTPNTHQKQSCFGRLATCLKYNKYKQKLSFSCFYAGSLFVSLLAPCWAPFWRHVGSQVRH